MSTSAKTRRLASQSAAVVAGASQDSKRSTLDLHALRRASGMSQQELAKLAEISRTRLSFAEQGTVELTQDELLRVIRAISEEPSRRAVRIREALVSAGANLHEVGWNFETNASPDSATATAEKGLFRSCEIYGSKLVEHLKTLMPVPAAEAMAGLAADALERESQTFGLTPQQAFLKIKKAQTVLSKSPTLTRGFIPVRPIAWYRDRRFADDPKSWEVEVQAR